MDLWLLTAGILVTLANSQDIDRIADEVSTILEQNPDLLYRPYEESFPSQEPVDESLADATCASIRGNSDEERTEIAEQLAKSAGLTVEKVSFFVLTTCFFVSD